MSDRFEVDPGQLTRVARDLNAVASDLAALHSRLAAVEAEIRGAGAAAGAALSRVSSARSTVRESNRHLDALQAEVKHRLRLLTASGNTVDAARAAEPEVADWSTTQKLGRALERALQHMPTELANQLRVLLTPENLAALAVILAVWAASQALGAGEIVDLIMAVGGLVMFGPDAIRAVQELASFATQAMGAQNESDLDEAGAHLATAVSIVGIDGAMALLAHRASGVAGDQVPRLSMQTTEMVTADGVYDGLSLGGSGLVDAPAAVPAQEAAEAGRVLANDTMGEYAARVPAVPGYFDVAIHGTPSDFWLKTDAFTGPIDHRTLAGIIRADPAYDGAPVRLLSCSSGALDDGVAQDLANQLGVEIMAPSDTLWIFSNGKMVIGPNSFTNSGVWRHFYPGGQQ